MKTLGIILVIAGVIALVYGGFSYSRDREVLDLGPLEIKTTEQKNFPIPAVIGGVILVTGFVLLISGNRRSRPL